MSEEQSSAAAILAAARWTIATRGPGKLKLSEVATAAGVSRPTLYRWFPTKDDLLEAVANAEIQDFVERLVEATRAHRSPGRRLDAALRLLVTYLDGRHDPIGADPGHAIRGLQNSLVPQVGIFVRLLGDALDLIPAVAQHRLTREQATEMLLRLAYSHYLVPAADPEEILGNIRSIAGLPRRSLSRLSA